MSEIQESIQILELFGEAAFRIGSVSARALQFLYANYYSKKLNEAGLKNFKTVMQNCSQRGIAPQLMNIETEDKAELDRMVKDLKKLGMQFAVLPDYIKDGFTQVMFPADQVSIFKAYVEKHLNAECKEMTVDEYHDLCPSEQRNCVLEDAAQAAGRQRIMDTERKKKLEERLNRPDLQEITINMGNVISETEESMLFRVPGTVGELGLILPKNQISQIEGKETFSVIMDKTAEYTAVELKTGRKITSSGQQLLDFFSNPYFTERRREQLKTPMRNIISSQIGKKAPKR